MKIPKLETGTLLIAVPGLQGDEFHRTVIYLTSHDENGATGLVLNRPMKLFLGQIFPEIKQTIPIFWGGPVGGDRLILLHNNPEQIPGSTEVGDSVYWGGDISAIKELLGTGEITPDDIRFFIGYSGWSLGQLEGEIQKKYWLVEPPGFDPLSAQAENLWGQRICGKTDIEIPETLFDDPTTEENEFLS